jgi:hypothetical protein
VTLGSVLAHAPNWDGTKLSAVQKQVTELGDLPDSFTAANVLLVSRNNLRHLDGLEQLPHLRVLSAGDLTCLLRPQPRVDAPGLCAHATPACARRAHELFQLSGSAAGITAAADNVLASWGEVLSLRACTSLEVIALDNNPLCSLPNYRAHVINMCPRLHTLDGKPVSR